MKMKILLLTLFIHAGNVGAEVISSPFGFTMEIPDTWQHLTADEIKNNPDLFDMNNSAGMSQKLYETVKPLILSGKAELIFLPDSSAGFADNINVIKQIGSVVRNREELAQVCDALPGQLMAAFRHPVKMYRCELIKKENFSGMYLEFDGAVAGTRSMQYHIPKSRNIYFIVTASVKDITYDKMKKPFHTAIGTFKSK